MKKSIVLLTLVVAAFLCSCSKNEISRTECDGYAFKDLNRNGVLDPYEDWRLTTAERAADLASQLPIERICGLMLYSSARWGERGQRIQPFPTIWSVIQIPAATPTTSPSV